MREKIQSIIQHQISQGCIFDAHSIIKHVIQNHSDDYLSFYEKGKKQSFITVRLAKQ
jgi:hypothetical protein